MKIVSKPLKVPHGRFCWGPTDGICEHFDNEGGHPSCEMGYWDQKRSPEGHVLKDEECLNLREIT